MKNPKEYLRRIKPLVKTKKSIEELMWEIKQNLHKLSKKNNRKKDYTISFCTVCKGRLWQLKQTLLKNINDNKDYKKCNFILIDYNSLDGMEEWVENNCKEFIKSKKLIYYKNSTFNDFNMSHAKNVSHRLATGEIIVNLDADNFTGKNFAEFINQEFKKTKDIVLVSRSGTGTNGRTCQLKKHFYGVRGYDEKFKTYGWEEMDFLNRIERKYHLTEIRIPKCFLTDIKNEIINKENKQYKKSMDSGIIEVNEQIYRENMKKGILEVNPNGYGKGIFIKNFKKRIELN